MRRAVFFSAGFALASPVLGGSGAVWATPHDSYSSSIGVLGCKVDTNRVAYWPSSVNCDNICVSLSYEGRSVYLIRVDQSQGAHDVSYDAWNYLYTGKSASVKPTAGGPIAMQYEDVEPSKCKDLIKTDGHKLPLSASNSMNFLTSCLAQPDTWVAKNHVLYNIQDSICTWGHDETCNLDLAVSNQAKCPSTLGAPEPLTDAPVYNIQYPTGDKVLASSGQVVGTPSDSSSSGSTPGPGNGASRLGVEARTTMTVVLIASLLRSL